MAMSYRYTPQEWEALTDKRVEAFNSSKFAVSDGFEGCAVCRNKRLVASRRGGGQESSFMLGSCTCRDMIARADEMKRSGMEKLLMQCGFENFLVRAPWQQVLLQCVRSCLDTTKWLLLCGQSGSGKTHLAVALCRELIARGEKVRYMSWPTAVRSLCAAVFDSDRLEQQLKPYLDAPVLFIDDLFKTRLNSDGVPEVGRQELDLAYSLIDHRYVHGKRTLITCEVSSGKLQKVSEALTGRILEKAGAFVQNVTPAPDRNWRTKTA